MNKNKKGKPYSFPDSFILVIGYIRTYLHLPYRQTEGVIKATGKSLPDHPSYGHICKRINRLRVDIKKEDDRIGNDDDDDIIVIAADSTGIKVTNRGQWMSDKWGLGKKGYLKIHIAVDIKTKEILALEVTDEKVHDGKVMKQLIEQVLNNNNNNTTTRRRRKNKIHSFIGDGAYDSNENFKFLKDCNIRPIIKVRRNSVVSHRNNKIRNREVKQQTKDLLKWKKKNRYGYRWMAETAFSSIKRMFSEYVMLPGFKTW